MVVKIIKRLFLVAFGAALAYVGNSAFPYAQYVPNDLRWIAGFAGWIIAFGALWSIVEIASADKLEKEEKKQEKAKQNAE